MARNKKQGDKFNAPFAASLRQLIEDHHVTQGAIASITGVTRQTVSQYCNGISEPGYDILVKIADHFNVSIDYLLGRTGDPRRQASAVDELGLSSKSVTILQKFTPDQCRGLECLFSSVMFCRLCESITTYCDIPQNEKMEKLNGEDFLFAMFEAGKKESELENELFTKYPELLGRITVVYGVNNAERIKDEIQNTFSAILRSLD